ncbi:MAG: hypothetical protein BGO77_00025 [Caedibacter sp. 37-49]|nr:MAG: hypothetical protein BGO77_00025 [Caedibacter sp. 37-49]
MQVYERTIKELSKLEEQRAKLDLQILDLQKKKNEEFLSLLNKVPSLNLDPMMLIGGLLHAVDEANKKPELKEKWRQAAQKFCKRLPSQKRTKAPQSTSQEAA